MREGFLLVNKPVGLTSHDVVEVVRRKLGLRRIGHTGTLDPIGRGLLILLVGPSTRHQQALQGHEKVYEATVRLGAQTDTADATGAVIRTEPVPPVEQPQLEAQLASLQGRLSQTPPAYSAVKVRGRPAYWWARRRRPVTLAPKSVQIHEISLVDATAETVTFRVRCSAGTYVRVLAESIAERLGTVGHLSALTRLAVGPWRLEEALSLDEVAQMSPEELAARLRPLGPWSQPGPSTSLRTTSRRVAGDTPSKGPGLWPGPESRGQPPS